MDKRKLQKVVERAEYAFWKVVSANYPEIKSGDVCPWAAILFQERLEKEVRSWYENNKS